MGGEKNLVSIICPSFNSGKFIGETIESVQAQSYSNWEMIIVDDCSSDNTISVVKRYQCNDSRVRLLQLAENCGAAVARNAAISIAKGRYLAFLDSDDMWDSTKLDKQLKFMLMNNLVFTFTAYREISEGGIPSNKCVDIGTPDVVDYNSMLKKVATMGCLTVMLDRKVVAKSRMPLIRRGQDYAFWLLILRSGIKARKINEVLALYRVREGSISRNKYKKILGQWMIYRKQEKISIYMSVWFLLNYAYRALFRR